MNQILDTKEYFCINCFENENIKKFIKDTGEKIKIQYECDFCNFESCDEYDIEECIQEHIDNCMQKVQERETKEDYENYEEAYELRCREECNQKYRKSCVDKLAVETYVVKQDILLEKLKKVIAKLYEHDDEHGFYGSASATYYTEGIDCPCKIAGLESTDEISYNIFGNDSDKINEFLENIYDFHECPWLCRCFDKDEGSRFGKWSDFCENVKHKARYFDHEEFKVKVYLDKFMTFFEIVKTSSYQIKIFRARIVDSEKTKQDIYKNPQVELGKVPLDKLKYAKNNRFSPIGISYGYYSFDRQTILAEIRANINDEVAIGEFQLDSDLKILDFRNKSLAKYKNPFNDVEFSIDIYCGEKFILDFLFDISKPINGSDTTLEYVPTQILSEYIWSLGYDGFIFDSSQNKYGENLVLFGENPSYTEREFVKIKEIDTSYIYV